jgi:hypothetical protein
MRKYEQGQAWQFSMRNGKWRDCRSVQGDWQEPDWEPLFKYRLHPHSSLIQTYEQGQAWQFLKDDCSSWCNQFNGDWIEPSWDEAIQYRLHPHNTLLRAFTGWCKDHVFGKYESMDAVNPLRGENTEYPS